MKYIKVPEPAPQYTFNKLDKERILKDALFFFLVPISFYITGVLGVIQLPDHIISLNDFVPSNNTVVIIIGWLGNQALSIIRKYVDGKPKE